MIASPLWAQTLDVRVQDSTPKPAFQFTPRAFEKAAISMALVGGALYCLASGKRDGNVGRMLFGAALALGACFVL